MRPQTNGSAHVSVVVVVVGLLVKTAAVNLNVYLPEPDDDGVCFLVVAVHGVLAPIVHVDVRDTADEQLRDVDVVCDDVFI